MSHLTGTDLITATINPFTEYRHAASNPRHIQ
jgi:hypothetical protein